MTYATSVGLVEAALDRVGRDRQRLATRVGVSVYAVHQWVQGRRRPNFEATQRLIAIAEEN